MLLYGHGLVFFCYYSWFDYSWFFFVFPLLSSSFLYPYLPRNYTWQTEFLFRRKGSELWVFILCYIKFFLFLIKFISNSPVVWFLVILNRHWSEPTQPQTLHLRPRETGWGISLHAPSVFQLTPEQTASPKEGIPKKYMLGNSLSRRLGKYLENAVDHISETMTHSKTDPRRALWSVVFVVGVR